MIIQFIRQYTTTKYLPKIFIDIRSKKEIEKYGMIPNARHIECENFITKVRHNKIRIPKTQEMVIYCQKGSRSRRATFYANRYGYNATDLEGGYFEWLKNYIKTLT